MHNYLYLWLGAHRAGRRGSGGSAVLLDRAAHAHLPVPPAILLLDDAWLYAQQEDMIQVNDTDITVTAPAALHQLIDETHFQRPVTLRAAFLTAAGQPAGNRPVQQHVDAHDQAAFNRALITIWAAGRAWLAEQADGGRLDVIIMEEIAAERRGTVTLQAAYADDLIHSNGDSFSLARFTTQAQEEGYRHRLRLLLRGLRRTLGDGDWQLSWADDGAVCWLLDLAPLTTNPARPRQWTPIRSGDPQLDEIFETPLPSPLDDMVVASNRHWLAFGRQFEPALPAGRDLIQVQDRRPVIDLAYVRDLEQRWGRPLLPAGAARSSRPRLWPPGRWPIHLRFWWWRRTSQRRQAAALTAITQLTQPGSSTPAALEVNLTTFIKHLGHYLLTIALTPGATVPEAAAVSIVAVYRQLQSHWPTLAGTDASPPAQAQGGGTQQG